jgi:RimJ/RimL family protein N-acetyltransferase
LFCFENGGKAADGWYAIDIAPIPTQGTLVGSGDYVGPPDSNGIVDIGYSALAEFQRRGYATKIIKTLINHAAGFAQTKNIIAHTSVKNAASKLL